jgi:oligoribonuclease (3'-5' exoribonuclease)
LKLIIEGWKPSLSKIKNKNEKHSLALDIHEQNQKTKHTQKSLQK